ADQRFLRAVNTEKNFAYRSFRVEALLPLPYFPARTPVGLRCSGLPQYAIPLRRSDFFQFVKGYVMARRVVVGGFRATCVLASAVSSVATRSLVKFFTPNDEITSSSSPSSSSGNRQPMEALESRQLLAGVTMGTD